MKAVLTLVDRVSPVLKGLKKEMRIASREMQKGISQIGDVAKTAGAAIVALAAAGGTTWAATVAAADASVALDTFSKQIGINVERLQAWQSVAVSTGMEAEEFSEALRDMNIELSDAATGGKDELAQLLKRVGISARDSSGNIRNANDVFLEFADAIARQTDPMIQYRMAILAFGEDTGAKILPILRQGSEAFRDSEEAMKAAGSAITDKQISRLKDFRNQWGLVKQSFSALSVGVLSRVAPSLSKLSVGFQETLDRVRPLINMHVEKRSEQLAQAIAKIPRDTVIRKIDALISGGEKLKKEFGVVGQVLGFVFENIGTLATIYLGTKALKAILSFGEAVIHLSKGIKILAVAVATFMRSNPILAIATAIATAAYLIYENWDSICDYFKSGFDKLKQYYEKFLGFIDSIREFLTPDFLKKTPEVKVAVEHVVHTEAQSRGLPSNNTEQEKSNFSEDSDLDNQPEPNSVDFAKGQDPTQQFYSTDGFAAPNLQKDTSFGPSVVDHRMTGRVDVNFNNAPEGLSIRKTSGSKGVDVDARVKYANTGRGPYAPAFAGFGGD